MFSTTRDLSPFLTFFFFNDTATTEIYTLSLHDALPIWGAGRGCARGPRTLPWLAVRGQGRHSRSTRHWPWRPHAQQCRSEEHTSELQSPCNLVCRLLLEKKKKLHIPSPPIPHTKTSDSS